MRILIVEDDTAVARSVREGLIAAAHFAQAVDTAEQARIVLNTDPFDLAIVDLGLPGADGLSLVRHLRKQGSRLPILILTARDGLADRVGALDLGADDYMIKPFDLPELIARCRALLRRTHGAASGGIELGRLQIDFATRHVQTGTRAIVLTRSEWAVFERLALQAGRVVDKEHLRAALAQEEREPSAHALEACISRLRAKLGDAVSISALRGLGYRLDDPRH